jgi:hypothetical protein
MDTKILERRLSKRPKKKNYPYPGAPNVVDPILDDLTTSKTDQEMGMIWNSPEIAYFIPLDDDMPPEYGPMAQTGFNTFLRHRCAYRQKKEESVDTKNLRGFSITKQISDEDTEGAFPSFETIDPKDLIVDSTVRNLQKAEQITHIQRLSIRELKGKPASKGWNKTAVAAVVEQLSKTDEEGTTSVQESAKDDNSTFKVTKDLVGINTSDTSKNEIVVWEVAHYATKWDVANSNNIVSEGDKCVTTICPDVPEQLLHTVRWIGDDEIVVMDDEAGLRELFAAETEGREPDLTETIPGKDKPWPYIQHRNENRSRGYYDSRGIGHTCMDNQIIATAVLNGKLVQLDYSMSPVFEGGGSNPNQQNVTIKPGVLLPDGIKQVAMKSVDQSLAFEQDAQRRVASQRTAAGGGLFSGEVSESRKLQKTATEVQADEAQGNTVSSSSVDRFNDADREMFPMLWKELKRMEIKLPMIAAGMTFEGDMDTNIYNYKFRIVPAASDKTRNPDLQFSKSTRLIEINAEHAALTGADIGAALKHATEQADPNMARTMYPDPEAGQLAIMPTIVELQQKQAEQDALNEQQSTAIEQNTAKADQALGLGTDVANAIS